MAMLIISPAEREKIAKAIAYAKAHPISFDELRKSVVPDADTIRLKDRQPDHARPESQHIEFPGGYRAAFSIEAQPAGLCTHLSISVIDRPKKGMLPNPQAVAMIAQEFGVPFPPDKGWTEEFDPGEYAVNLVSLYAPKQEGNA